MNGSSETSRPAAKPRRRRVALLVETSNAYGRGLLRGIMAYQREHQIWSTYLCRQDYEADLGEEISRWQGDGVIARIENQRIADSLRRLKIPVVSLSTTDFLPGIPCFENDYDAIARLAVQHFTARGFRRVAFFGASHVYGWAKILLNAFLTQAAEADVECSVFRPSGSTSRKRSANDLELLKWLKSLEKPVGIFACNDYAGRMLLDACQTNSIRVPDEVAVLAEDNDEVFCELADPLLSSIKQNSRKIGYDAAAALDQMMDGVTTKPSVTRVPPIEVVVRQSTDVLAVEDRSVASAVRFISEHACEGINVKDVLNHNPQSRRILEAKFKKLLGRTPHEEILCVRLKQVKTLLIETDLTLEAIADKCGFAHVEYLSVAFKRIIGIPPREYRSLNRR
jgi:LacI family transcriptional regulator